MFRDEANRLFDRVEKLCREHADCPEALVRLKTLYAIFTRNETRKSLAAVSRECDRLQIRLSKQGA